MLDDTVDASTVTRELGGCPVKCFTVFDDQEAGRYWQEANALREETLGLDGAEDKIAGMVAALDGIRGYFVDVIAARRARPGDPETDLVSHLLASTVDGAPLSDTVLLDMCTVLVLAGLDTTRPTTSDSPAGRTAASAPTSPAARCCSPSRSGTPRSRIATDAPLAERGGQLALLSLPLAWDTVKSEGTTA